MLAMVTGHFCLRKNLLYLRKILVHLRNTLLDLRFLLLDKDSSLELFFILLDVKKAQIH